MTRLIISLILMIVSTAVLSIIHYFATANQYISGNSVNEYYVITFAYVAWTVYTVAFATMGRSIWAILAFLSIVPLISIIGGELMFSGSILFTLVLGIIFSGFNMFAVLIRQRS